MSKSLWTNEVMANVRESSIEKDFDFYKITTSDKYIKGGTAFLDADASFIRSIVYERGKSFYIMTQKNTTSRSELMRKLEEYDDAESLSLVQVNVKEVPQHLLIQLFLNALSNPTNELCSYNNLSGKLLCYKPSWIDRNNEGVIWGLNCIEIRLSEDMCIHLKAHRMTSVMLKNKMKFQKRKFHEYPQYEFSYNNHTLKRVGRDGLDNKTNLIQKPLDGEKGKAIFFDFADYDTFSCTKIGVLYDILNLIKQEYSAYVELQLKEYTVDSCLQYKRKELEEYKPVVSDVIADKGVILIDEVKSSTSEEYLNDVANEMITVVPGVNATVGKRLSKKKLNVRYIHDKNYYDSEDPHQNDLTGYVVQHITVENFKHSAQSAVFNVLKELVIKNDLKNGKISIINWEKYGFLDDWIFGTVFDKEYFFIKIHPDGSFIIEQMERNLFNMSEYDEYMDYLGINEKSVNDYRGVIGVVKDAEGNVNLIKDTNKYSVPDIEQIGDILKEVSENHLFNGDEVVSLLRNTSLSTSNKKVSAEIEALIPSIELKKTYSKKDVMNMLSGRTTKKEVVKFVYENTGIKLYAYLRGEECRNDLLSGNIDINFIRIGNDSAMYCVGEVGNGLKYTFERTSVMREIQAVPGSEMIFEKLLPLMGVEFVRYGMLTVVPFPFKYLREYADLVRKI